MLCKRIIPCLDVKDGRVVKGTQFVGLKDAGDPVEQAKRYNDQGADELCFLDITASIEKRGLLVQLIQETSDQVFIPLTVGGGVKSLADIEVLLKAGADKVAVNTAAIDDPDLIEQAGKRFGSQCIVVAVDAKSRVRASEAWEVYVHGGRTATGKDVIAWVKEAESRGAGEILLTSMDRDGSQTGYDLSLTRQVVRAVGIPVIASGGVGDLEHLLAGLQEGEADAVLAASIFHYHQYTIAEVKKYLSQHGIPVRQLNREVSS